MSSSIVSAIILMTILITLGLAFILPRRKIKQEQDLTPLHQTNCSGSFGRSQIKSGTNLPLHRFSLYEKFMVIGFLLGPICIPYNEIKSIEISKRIIGYKINIMTKHSNSFYVLNVLRCSKITEILSKKLKGAFSNDLT